MVGQRGFFDIDERYAALSEAGEARTAIFDYIEVFYNRQRAHATLRFLSPVEFENLSRVVLQNCPGNPG